MFSHYIELLEAFSFIWPLVEFDAL